MQPSSVDIKDLFLVLTMNFKLSKFQESIFFDVFMHYWVLHEKLKQKNVRKKGDNMAGLGKPFSDIKWSKNVKRPAT